jgi:hypothetical protein
MKKTCLLLIIVAIIMMPLMARAEDGEDTGLTSMFETGLGIGAVTIDGELYNQIAFRPTFTIGKLMQKERSVRITGMNSQIISICCTTCLGQPNTIHFTSGLADWKM